MNRPWCTVVRLGGIGDNLIASSVLPLLARDYKLEVIAQSPQHVIFENNPHIDRLVVKAPGDITDWPKWFGDRAKESDKFVHLTHSCEMTLAFLPGQIPEFTWPASVRRKLCARSYLEFVHDIAEVPYEFDPHFYPDDDEWTKARTTKAKVGARAIGWILGGSRLDKRHPYSPMIIGRLIKELNVPVIMFGASGGDFELAKEVQEHVTHQNGSDNNLHLALSAATEPTWTFDPNDTHVTEIKAEPPRWPIRRALTQLQLCDLVIGPDTGLMWGVATRKMPKIVLLSHASPLNITHGWINTTTLHADQVRVPCWPCHQLHNEPKTCTPNKANTGAACISDLDAETIVQTARAALLGNTDLFGEVLDYPHREAREIG